MPSTRAQAGGLRVDTAFRQTQCPEPVEGSGAFNPIQKSGVGGVERINATVLNLICEIILRGAEYSSLNWRPFAI